MSLAKKHEYLKLESSGKKRHAASTAWEKKKKKRLSELKKKTRKLSAIKKKSRTQKASLARAKKKLALIEAQLERNRKEKTRIKRRKKIKAMLEAMLRESEKNKARLEEAKRHGRVIVQEIETIEGKKKLDVRPAEIGAPEPTAFYIRIDPWEMRLIEKSRHLKPGKTSSMLKKEIEKNTDLRLVQAKLEAVEEQLNELFRSYGIKKGEIKTRNWKEPILSLIELDKRITKETNYKLEAELSKQNLEAMRQRAIELAEQAVLHRKIFESARVYAFIQKKRNSRLEEIASALGLETKTAKECTELLLERGLVDLKRDHFYPTKTKKSTKKQARHESKTK